MLLHENLCNNKKYCNTTFNTSEKKVSEVTARLKALS